MDRRHIITTIYDKLSAERKLLQTTGDVPEFMTTGGWQLFKDKYLHEARGLRDTYLRIAQTLSKHMIGYEDEWEAKFFNLLWKGYLAPSTPVLSNTGTTKGLPVSCSGQYIGDSIDEFYGNRKETAILTKNGFGTSGYLGDIRSRGSKISAGGTASGVLPVFKGFVQDMRDVAQGTSRRGAWAGYLPLDHGDFFEVAESLQNEPDDLNIGWVVSDDFITRLNSKDLDAVQRYQKALRVKALTGKGYFFFVDKVNRANPTSYKVHGLDVKASNLCVAPETLVLTAQGNKEIKDLEGFKVPIWNGEEFSEVDVVKTGSNQKLLKVVTDSGYELECTPYHKFYVQLDYKGTTVCKRAGELKTGDMLIKHKLPVTQGDKELSKAYQNGFYSGDGCSYKGKSIVYLYHDKMKLSEYFDWDAYTYQPKQKRIAGTIKGLEHKFFVPLGYSVESKLKWFAGACDADGTIARNGLNESLQYCSVNKEYLKGMQLLLQELGVQSKIKPAHIGGPRMLPANDETGELKEFICQPTFRLLVGSNGLQDLMALGCVFHRLVVSNHTPNRNSEHFVKILEVKDEGRISDTYCFTEPKRSMGMFNGLLTGNCTEIMLHSSTEETFTCVLSSLNLSKYDEWKDTDAIFNSIVFLDCVASEFIALASTIPSLEKAVRGTANGRPLGLGTLGFHTYLQQKMIAFESFEAHQENHEIFGRLQREGTRATEWLANKYGEPKYCKGLNRRNTHLFAVAPNTSSALLCGGVSQGIEPVVANVYNQPTAAGEIYRVNPVFLSLAKSRVGWDNDIVKSIINNNGSIQHLEWLSDHEKEVFKTAYEINQEAILRLASARQRYIDQGQSVNLFFDADADESYISKIHQIGFKDENIKALYYMRTKAGVQASTGDCVACEG